MASTRSAAGKQVSPAVTSKPPRQGAAPSPEARRAARRKAAKSAASASAALVQRVERLQARLRLLRLRAEAVPSDEVVVVRPPAGARTDSVELQTVSAINLGNAAKFFRDKAGEESARLDVVRHIEDSVVMRANSAAVRAVRLASPGLKIFPATYAYPQYIRPLGDQLAEVEIQVRPGAPGKKFAVRLLDTDGAPLAGIKVRALVDWDTGAHIAAVSDAEGIARFRLPPSYADVKMVFAEPEHTHWSVFRDGFARAAAPAMTDVVLPRLVPDAFRLLSHYAPYDANAGEGVRVGVIDSGVGPHRDLTVAGGACLVSGEDGADFLDNGIGHGTHVAGTIAARLSPGGLYGLAPACRLMAYRVCPKTGRTGRAASTDIAAALEQAIADGCDLVNISMGSVEAMPEVPDILERARAAGMVVFAATGNDGQELLRYPARYSHTLGVGALGRDGTFPSDCPEASAESEIRQAVEFVADFSNHGLGTDFIGPGVAMLSTYPGDRYAMMSGTSMATPFTTGMAARLLSAHPILLTMPRSPARADAIVHLLSEAARKPGWPDLYDGFGVLK